MSWWRTQRRALVAAAAAAVAVVGVQIWFQVLPTLDAETPAPIVAEGPVELGGHRLELGSTRWDEFDAPTGSRTLSIRLRAHSDPDAAGCAPFTLSEAGGDRVWLDAGSDLDIDSDDERYCQEDSASYRILAVFLLPDDAEGPFRLDVPVGDDHESIRFRIDG